MTEAGGPIPWELPPPWGDPTSLDGVLILCRPLDSTNEEDINRRAALLGEVTVSVANTFLHEMLISQRRNARFIGSEAQVADSDIERLGLVHGVDTLRPVPIERLCSHKSRALRRIENERRLLAPMIVIHLLWNLHP